MIIRAHADHIFVPGTSSCKATEMSQTPTPGFFERFESCDLLDFKKEDIDMITREMNILYSKLREYVIYNATSLEIFMTYLREGNLHLAELFRTRALFELVNIEEDREYIKLMEEHKHKDGSECVVQYSEHYFDPEEMEQGPTHQVAKWKQIPQKVNSEEIRSIPNKRLKDNTEVACVYFDPEFEKRRELYKLKSQIRRKMKTNVSVRFQHPKLTEQRLSPEGGYSTKKDRNDENLLELRQQNIEAIGASDNISTFLCSKIDAKVVVHEGVKNLKPNSVSERSLSVKSLKENTDNIHVESTRRLGIVGDRMSPIQHSDNVNSVSYVINDNTNHLGNDKSKNKKAKDEQVTNKERNDIKSTWNPLKENTAVLSENNINTLDVSKSTLSHDEYMQTKGEENGDNINQPSDCIDLTNLMGPDMSGRSNRLENDDSVSPEQKELDKFFVRSPISQLQESDNTSRYLLISVNADDPKTTMDSKKERVDDEKSNEENDSIVIQRQELNPKLPHELIEVFKSPCESKEEKVDTITEKETYEKRTLKLIAEHENTNTESIDRSSASLEGKFSNEILTKQSVSPVGNPESSENRLICSSKASYNSSEANSDDKHLHNTKNGIREIAINVQANIPDSVNLSSVVLNASEQGKKTDSSVSIWRENESNVDDRLDKPISSTNTIPNHTRETGSKDESRIHAMNAVDRISPDSIGDGILRNEAKKSDAINSASDSAVVSKNKNSEKSTSVLHDKNSDGSLPDTNRTDRTLNLEIRTDAEKQKFITVDRTNNGQTTHITQRLTLAGNIGCLSPIEEGDQKTDETYLKVSQSNQQYLEDTTKTTTQMKTKFDGMDVIKSNVNTDHVDVSFDEKKSGPEPNIGESEYQASTNKSQEIDVNSQISNSVKVAENWKENVEFYNIALSSESKHGEVSSESHRTENKVEDETVIEQEGTESQGSASHGLNAINTAINTDSHFLSTDNLLEMRQTSLPLQLSAEKSYSDSLWHEKRASPVQGEIFPDVDEPRATQNENKTGLHYGVVSKDTNGWQINNLDMTSEDFVRVKSINDINLLQNENSKHSTLHISDDSKLIQTDQSHGCIGPNKEYALSELGTQEKAVSFQSDDFEPSGQDSTPIKNQDAEKKLTTNKCPSDPSHSAKDTSSTKYVDKEIENDKKTYDRIKAEKVLRRVNEKMIKLEKQEEMDRAFLKEHNVHQLHQASEELLWRSEEASLLLKQGNPNIVDLSDNNRSTKLAERFSELYDNEYTDAFEELQNLNIDERKITHVLLCIVKNVYYFCSEKASNERNSLMYVIKNVPAATSNGNPLKQEALRKGIVAQSLKDKAQRLSTEISKEFFEGRYQSLIPEGIDSRSNRMLKYAQLCVEIVWWMCVQDPPIYLSWIEETESREFDKDEYRSYTKSGKTVDFCVWPIVHLCKGGPLLAKGIAQGK